MAGELWVAEWFRPGLDSTAAQRLGDDLRAVCDLAAAVAGVDLLDCAWLPDDETITARFRGDRAGVVAACSRANAPIDRLSAAIEIGP